MFPILTSPPTSFPIPSLWVIPVHQPRASYIMHRTWTGNSFHIYYTCFNAILPYHLSRSSPCASPKHPVSCIKLRLANHFLPDSTHPSHISIQFSSVTQSCPTLCDPMNRSTPGLPVHHQLPEFTETHVHRVSDAIQPSHPLSSPSPPAPNPSQHHSLFQ